MEPATRTIEKQLRGLKERVGGLESALVAFSGGTDSTLLVRVARDELGERAVALTAVSPSLAREELEESRAFARAIGIRHLVLESREMENPDYVRNPEDRCYFCKSELFRLCRDEAARLGLRWVVEGSQKDDLADIRPGRRAAEELGVRSPLVEAGLGKTEVRAISRLLGLPTWDKPAMACLASRFPTGTPITEEGLGRVERCERFLRERGFRLFRVRVEGRNARVELGPEETGRLAAGPLRPEFVSVCRENGFARVVLDLEGYRQGGREGVDAGFA
ncbi:MAG: ATP-dependent sacrificial sulfur transferase LarE [Candidatus Eisenbacteria bacterium]